MKSNFFRVLVDPNSSVSSKRFAGLVLLGLFGFTATLSMFITVDAYAVELIKLEGVLGASLLGVNAFETAMSVNKAKKNNEQDSK